MNLIQILRIEKLSWERKLTASLIERIESVRPLIVVGFKQEKSQAKTYLPPKIRKGAKLIDWSAFQVE